MNLRLLPLFLIAFPSALFASTEEAQKRLDSAIQQVLTVATEAPDLPTLTKNIRPVLRKFLSFDAMTRRAVGPGWRQFSKAQQEETTNLFTTLIIRTYSKKLTPGEQPETQFKKPTTPAPGRVDIPTSLLYKGSRYNVVYRMEESEDWRVTDVVLEGVSLIANYRTQLDSQFKTGGAPAVIKSLSASLARPQ